MKAATPSIGIYAAAPLEINTELKAKANELSLKITNAADLLLIKTLQGWKLSSQDKSLLGEVYIDFVGGKNARRKKYPGTGKQPLAKAVGIKKGLRPTILDATAGLGADAYLLASLGCKIWLCERNPIIATLLKDALHRAVKTDGIASLFSQSMLFVGATLDDAKNNLDAPPDVIYLDPMYPKPVKKRSANVKKEMQILRVLLSADLDAKDWLEKARNWSKKVVVKRPSWAESLATDAHGCVQSKNHRYDIFLGKN